MSKTIGRLFLAASMIATLTLAPVRNAAASTTIDPTVIISEIGWAGSATATADEWLELTNLTEDPIDIGGWTISGAGTSGGTLTVADGSVIGPSDSFLIANYANTDEKSTLDVVPDSVTTSVSLSNSALSLLLLDRDGALRDAAGDESAPFQGSSGGSDQAYVAMVRLSPVNDGSLAESWTSAEQSIGFDAGASELGTPGTIEEWFLVSEVPTETEEPEPEPTAADPAPVEPESEEEIPEIPDETTLVEEPAEETVPEEVVFETEEPALETVQEEPAPEPIVETPEDTSVEETADVVPATESTTTTEEPAPSSYPPGTLLINEFVSDAEEEWIEIYNPFNTVIPLLGWSVRDASGKSTSLPDQLLGMDQYVVISNPSGKLNNDGDTIELLDPTGQMIDSVTYGTDDLEAPEDDRAAALGASGWSITTTPTQGTANVFTSPESDDPPETEETQTSVSVSETSSSSSAAEPTDTEETESTPIPWAGPKTLRLSELYPNTVGDDMVEEFVELENVGTESIDVYGWTITDASGRTYVVPEPTILQPGAFLALTRAVTDVSLNNAGDTITLIAPDGMSVDTCTYESSPKGSSLIRSDSQWVWSTTPTPNEPNVVPGNADAESPAIEEPGEEDAAVTTAVVRMRVEGTVLVTPGVLGKQIFYITTEQGGIQVYRYDAVFPPMAEGDRVAVTGTMTESRGEPRLKVGKEDIITVIGSGEPVVPEDRSISELSAGDHGRLMRVTGIVLVKSGNNITIEQDGSKLAIRVADGTEIDLGAFARGNEVTVTGILVAASGTLTLLPRSPEDVTEQLAATEAFTEAATLTGKEARGEQDQRTAAVITAGTLLVLATYAGRKLIPKYKLWYAKTRALRAASQATH